MNDLLEKSGYVCVMNLKDSQKIGNNSQRYYHYNINKTFKNGGSRMRLLCVAAALMLLSACQQLPTVSSYVSSMPMSSVSVSSSAVSSQSLKQASESVSTSSLSSQVSELQEEENLWETVWISFEKSVYGAETPRLYLWVNNRSTQPVYIMRAFYTEQLIDGNWVPIDTERELDNPGIQFPVEPGESRLVGVYMGWMRQPSERYGDERVPAGSYRIKICLNREHWFQIPFEIQEDPLEQDTTNFEIRTLRSNYHTNSDYIDYEIVNKTEQEIAFDYACTLEKWDGEVWKPYPVDGTFPEIAMSLCAGETVHEHFSLVGLEEPLEIGRYRLVKTLLRNTYYAEFEVSNVVIRPAKIEMDE